MAGGGYDFDAVRQHLRSLASGLSREDGATLRAELVSLGHSVRQLSSSLAVALPNAISVFFNPAAGDAMVCDPAI